MNLNDRVKVVLTQEGANIYNSYYEDTPSEYRPDRKIVGEVLTDQLWGIMQVFGNHISLGRMSPFKDCQLEIINREVKINDC